MNVSIVLKTAFLLICSNAFMTFAWYAHLRNWNDKRWYIAAILSWSIAFLSICSRYLQTASATRP